MESKFIMFSIIKLKFDRVKNISSGVELEISENATAIVKLTKDSKCLVRIKVDVNITPTPITDDSEPMIELISSSDYEFPEKPQDEDIDSCVVTAINSTRKALKGITEAVKINPIEMDEISITDVKQM